MGNAAAVLFILADTAAAGGADVERAQDLYRRTNYAAAIRILLDSSSNDAAGNALLGKSFYMQGRYNVATAYLEKAVAAEPTSTEYYDWLGKAYGRRAEHAIFVSALPLAIKTRECFEKAVSLDGTNGEALGDLFEFYLEAPPVVGGGTEKAERIAARISQLNEAESHYVRARLAEKRKNNREAENEYRKAMEAAPNQAGRIVDLADFLSRQGRYEESDRLFDLASQTEPGSAKVVFARASAYVRSKRNLTEARNLLQQYAGLQHTPDDPPETEVARLALKLR